MAGGAGMGPGAGQIPVQRRVLLREQTPVPDVLACDDRSLILCLSDMSRLSGTPSEKSSRNGKQTCSVLCK